MNENREIMAKGKCSNCCRPAEDLLKCAGACGGEDMYCNRTCQKADWAMHKKICPRGDAVAQPLTFLMPPPDRSGLPEAPVRAVRKMDGYGNSGIMLPYSGHHGIDRLIPYARRLCCDEDDEDKVRNAVEAMIGGDLS